MYLSNFLSISLKDNLFLQVLAFLKGINHYYPYHHYFYVRLRDVFLSHSVLQPGIPAMRIIAQCPRPSHCSQLPSSPAVALLVRSLSWQVEAWFVNKSLLFPSQQLLRLANTKAIAKCTS